MADPIAIGQFLLLAGMAAAQGIYFLGERARRRQQRIDQIEIGVEGRPSLSTRLDDQKRFVEAMSEGLKLQMQGMRQEQGALEARIGSDLRKLDGELGRLRQAEADAAIWRAAFEGRMVQRFEDLDKWRDRFVRQLDGLWKYRGPGSKEPGVE